MKLNYEMQRFYHQIFLIFEGGSEKVKTSGSV